MKTKTFVLIICGIFLICLASGTWATVIDDFEDNEYTSNPVWTVEGGAWATGAGSKYHGSYGISGTGALTQTPASPNTDLNYSSWVNTRTMGGVGSHAGFFVAGATGALWQNPTAYFKTRGAEKIVQGGVYNGGFTYTASTFPVIDNNWYRYEIKIDYAEDDVNFILYNSVNQVVWSDVVNNQFTSNSVAEYGISGDWAMYYDYLLSGSDVSSVTTDFTYNIDKVNFKLDLNDASVGSLVTLNDWNWLVDGVTTGLNNANDRNTYFSPIVESTDYNVCLSSGGSFGGANYSGFKCKTINSGRFYGDTNFRFYDENTSLPIAATIDFNGTQYTGTSFYLPTRQIVNDSNTNVFVDFNISMSGYGSRQYSIDMNWFTDLNVDFLLLPSTQGSSVEMKVYQLDGNTIYNNVFVELVKPNKGNASAGRFKTDSTGNGTVFLSLIDSNYTSKVNNDTNTYYPVMLSILYPKNEASLAQITEKWKIDITQNLFMSFTDLNTTKVLYLLPNTNLPFNIKIQDVNANYFSRTYTRQYAGNPLTDTLQPYLVSSATGLLTTINSISATTNQPLPGITFKVYKNISGSGRTLVETVTTDSKGQSLILSVLNADYEVEAYNGVTFVKTFNITATSSTIYFIIALGSTVVNPPAASGFSASWTPLNGLTKATTGTQVFTQTLQNFGASTISVASTLTQNGSNLAAPQNYSGALTSKTFTYTIAWADINVGTVVSKMIVTNSYGNVYTFTQNYIVSTSYGSGYTPMQGLQTGLRSDLQCSSNTLIPCYPLLIIAVILCIALGLVASFAMGQYGSQSAGIVVLIGMILFTYLTWIPLWLTAGLVIIMLAFIVNERRS